MEGATFPHLRHGLTVHSKRPALGSVFEIAGRFVFFESNGTKVPGLAELLAGYYCTAVGPRGRPLPDATIRWRLEDFPGDVAEAFQQFEISGGGVGSTDGRTCIFDFENARVLVPGGDPHRVDVLMRRELDLERPNDLQVVNYAISTALRRCDLYELHSAAVVSPHNSRGVLIAGPSGCGKSTLTVQLVAQGWRYLTDDVLFLKPARGAINAYPLRRAFAITQSTVEAGGRRVQEAFANADWFTSSKKPFMPNDVFPDSFLPNCEPHAIFFPTITDEDRSIVKSLSRSETMIQLIKLCPWSCYDPVTSTRHLQALSELARQCRGFVLLAGKDLLRDSARASELMLEYSTV